MAQRRIDKFIKRLQDKFNPFGAGTEELTQAEYDGVIARLLKATEMAQIKESNLEGVSNSKFYFMFAIATFFYLEAPKVLPEGMGPLFTFICDAIISGSAVYIMREAVMLNDDFENRMRVQDKISRKAEGLLNDFQQGAAPDITAGQDIDYMALQIQARKEEIEERSEEGWKLSQYRPPARTTYRLCNLMGTLAIAALALRTWPHFGEVKGDVEKITDQTWEQVQPHYQKYRKMLQEELSSLSPADPAP